jgi:hypothetical protein
MGASSILSKLTMFANIFTGARLRERVGKFYGITMRYRKDPQPLREDLTQIFALLAEKKIDPLIAHTFPLLDAEELWSFWPQAPWKARSCSRIHDRHDILTCARAHVPGVYVTSPCIR